jgi:hypothetical protein
VWASAGCSRSEARRIGAVDAPSGRIELRKDLEPNADPGRFNLLIRQGDTTIDGDATNVGDSGTTGENTVNTGTYQVSETAGTDPATGHEPGPDRSPAAALPAITGKLDRLIPWEQTERAAREAPNGTFLLHEDGNHGCANVPYKTRPLAADTGTPPPAAGSDHWGTPPEPIHMPGVTISQKMPRRKSPL